MTSVRIADDLARVRERIALAAGESPSRTCCNHVDRSLQDHPAEAIREAWAAGVRHFGENRVQEWEGKRTQLAGITGAYTSHLIGHFRATKRPAP